MLERKSGCDIVAEIGKISSFEAAQALFEERMNATHLRRIRTIQHPEAVIKIANAIVMCDPAEIFVSTGSAEDLEFIRQAALTKGEEKALAIDGHTVHFDLKEEQGRLVDHTFYIINDGELVSTLGKNMVRHSALEVIRESMSGVMRGRTMYVGFFSRGPVGAPASNPALEISSSAYVMHSAYILYRNCYESFNQEVEARGHFFANIHSEGENRPEDLPNARIFMDRAWWTTYSVFCTYAGNTLLLKKGNHRFAVDKAVLEGEGLELAEHMFVTGVEGPGGRVTWCAGAAPSGCGKTTTAMAGDHFLGDDLAQCWIAADGSIRSINPECGIFGILKDVNWEGDPHLMEVLRRGGSEVIFSNALVDEKGTPRWTGDGDPGPERGFNFQGEWWAGKRDEKGQLIPISHPNSRCTVTASALSNYSREAENPAGVDTRIFTYSGRDADTMPPVWVAKSSDEGVAIGACIVSASTATEVGVTGIRRAPWANAPFIPGSLGDNMRAQFDFFANPKIAAEKRPLLAGMNYFLTDASRGGDSSKLLGEKRDVKVWLSWLERRAHGEVAALEAPIGYLPLYEDLERLFKERIDKVYDRDLYRRQFSLYVDKIFARIDLQMKAYREEAHIPDRFFDILTRQELALQSLKDEFGPIVTPDQLPRVS
jgi:phosphoenolpyruvate carboxykinase (GTP)